MGFVRNLAAAAVLLALSVGAAFVLAAFVDEVEENQQTPHSIESSR